MGKGGRNAYERDYASLPVALLGLYSASSVKRMGEVEQIMYVLARQREGSEMSPPSDGPQKQKRSGTGPDLSGETFYLFRGELHRQLAADKQNPSAE